MTRATDREGEEPRPAVPQNEGAVVIGGTYRGLSTVRSLGRHGIPVWLLTSPHMVTWTSRYVRRSLAWPDGETEKLEYLLDLGERYDLAGWAVFPTDDRDAALISRHHSLLSKRFLLTTPPWETMKRLHDKRLLHRLASELGIDQPWTSCPANREELAELDCSYPVILKPAMKEEVKPFTFAKAWKVENREELLACYDQARAQVDPSLIMVQDLIPGHGEDYAYAALCRDGHPLASLTAWRPRQYPIDFGRGSTYVRTVALPDIERQAERLLAATDLTGIAHVGFKRDLRDGRYKLLDVNLRAWGSQSLGRQVGIDFPYLLWQLVHGELVSKVHAPAGLRWIRLANDLPTAALLIRRRELSLGSYLESLCGPMEFAIFAADDPLPALADLPLLLLRVWKRTNTRYGERPSQKSCGDTYSFEKHALREPPRGNATCVAHRVETVEEVTRAQIEQGSFPRAPAFKQQLKRVIYSLASPFAIGPKNIREGVVLCRELNGHGIPSTLGKFSKAGDDPAEIVQEYCLASNSLRDSLNKNSFYLSLKPPSLDFQPEYVRTIADTALCNGHRVHFDSHGHDLAEPSLSLLKWVTKQPLPSSGAPPGWQFSVTVPSRWKRSMTDAEWVSEMGVRARLVKGEFKASSSSDEVDPRQGFLALVDRLAGTAPEIAVATHDYALAREAIARCQSAGTPVELELLFGIPAGNMVQLSREMSVPIRFYVPYGDTLLIYGMRHFLTNPHKVLRPHAREVISCSRSKLDRIIRELA